MRWIDDAIFRARALFAPGRMERDLDEEMKFHVEMETSKLVAGGADPVTAQRQAAERFGSAARQRDRARWAWGTSWVRDVFVDARLVGRQIRRNPGFASGVIVTLGLGIGANTAIFSVAEHALLQAPPVLEPDRLAAVYTTCRRGALQCSSSYPDYVDYRDLSRSFTDMAAYTSVPLNVGDTETARLARGVVVTGNYFSLLGVRPELGRFIQPADNETTGAELVAVLSHEFWREAFASDANIVGEAIRLNEARFTVIGVAPKGFRGLNLSAQADVWVPMFSGFALGAGVGAAADPEAAVERGNRWIGTVVGRLEPEATFARASAEMDNLALRLGEQYPDERAAIGGSRGITVDPIGAYILPLGNEAALRQFVYLLLGVVGLTLLLAAANLANLFLARATSREQEIGVRMAVGAGRGRVTRQLVTESLVLSMIGGAVGLVVAAGVVSMVEAFDLPGGVSIATLDVGLNPRVLGFAMGLSILTALLFGLVPALHAARRDLVRSVKGNALGRRGQGPLRKALVSVQVALCLVLLVGSGLFLRTLQNSLDAELGFEPDRGIAARFNLSLLGYSEERAQGFVSDLLSGVRALPGVTAASIATVVPFQGGGFRGTFAEIDGYVPQPDEEIRVDFVVIETDYFAALGTRVIEGREFTTSDRDGGPSVIVINQHMADLYWAGRSPVGSRATLFGQSVEIVGVVENSSWTAVGEDATPFVFVPQVQAQMVSESFFTLIARTDRNPSSLLPAVRERFETVEPNLSLTSLQTLEDQVGIALMPQRMGTVLLTMLGLLALTLAAVGVFAVVSYTVKRRARDIGIRIAVGATRGRILKTVLTEMLIPIGAGLALGGLTAAALSRTVATFMFGVSPSDPLTYLAIGLLLVVVAMIATLIPARKASRLDPVRVLKTD